MAQFIRYLYMGRELIEWNIEEMCGYKPKTTYYMDFGIAEWFGKESVRETFDNAVKNWGKSIEWMTEITMVLNWKIWEKHALGEDEWAKYYNALWEEACEYVLNHFEGDDLAYYFRTTD